MENSGSTTERPTHSPTTNAEDPHGLDSSTCDDVVGNFARGPIQTSTPMRWHVMDTEKPVHVRNDVSANCSTVTTGVSSIETDGDVTQHAIDEDVPIKIPILGYETVEEREKFTVFKLEVRKNSFGNWFIFRRYSDFERLKRQLKRVFPDVHLPLPPKKFFGNNFETGFLDERMSGLQNFVDLLVSNKEINSSEPVTQFFCYNEPPGPYESLEESRALCESLEDQVYRLTTQLQERDEKIRKLEAELVVSNEKIAMMEQREIHSYACICQTKTQQDVDSNENFKLKHNSYS